MGAYSNQTIVNVVTEPPVFDEDILDDDGTLLIESNGIVHPGELAVSWFKQREKYTKLLMDNIKLRQTLNDGFGAISSVVEQRLAMRSQSALDNDSSTVRTALLTDTPRQSTWEEFFRGVAVGSLMTFLLVNLIYVLIRYT